MIYNVIESTGAEYEFDFINEVQKKLVRYILFDYPIQDAEFAELLSDEGGGISVWDKLKDRDCLLRDFWEEYKVLFNYFDDWVVVIPDKDMKCVEKFKLHLNKGKHIETIEW